MCHKDPPVVTGQQTCEIPPTPPGSPPVLGLPAVTQPSCWLLPQGPLLANNFMPSQGLRPGAGSLVLMSPGPSTCPQAATNSCHPPVRLAPDPSPLPCLTSDPVAHARTLANPTHPSSPSSCQDPGPNTNLTPAALNSSPDCLYRPSPLSPRSCPPHSTGSCLQASAQAGPPSQAPLSPRSSSQGCGRLLQVYRALRSSRVGRTRERRGTQGTR